MSQGGTEPFTKHCYRSRFFICGGWSGRRFWQSLVISTAFCKVHLSSIIVACWIKWNWILSNLISNFIGSKTKTNNRFILYYFWGWGQAWDPSGRAGDICTPQYCMHRGRAFCLISPPPTHVATKHNKIQKKQENKSSYSQICCTELKHSDPQKFPEANF